VSEPSEPSQPSDTGTDPGPVVLVVDVANVMGSRPDGWWRDRAGAASRLLSSLVPLAGQVVWGPVPGEPVGLSRIVAVVEGQARRAVRPDGVEVVLAPADGDSSIVAAAREVVAAGGIPLVVTADRGLRERLPAGARITGPSWLLGLL
jgi:hypothetical protein